MSNYIYKLLMIDGVLPHANEELRDIVMASDGDGYKALYNILRCVHPNLTAKKVETKIPCQGISDTFAHHVKNIRSTIENEAIRGRIYTRYKGRELVLGILHPKYEAALPHNTEMAFENSHDQVNNIPFELQMSNLGKTLGGWAQKLGLKETISPRLSKVTFTNVPASSTSRVASLSVGLPYDFCQMPGHTKDTCKWFVNHIITAHFKKENPTLTMKVLCENRLCIRIKRNNGDHHGNRLKAKSTITHLAEDIVALDDAPPNVAHIGVNPDMDDCDEIIHDMSAMVCRLVTDADEVDFEGANEDIFLDRPVHFDELENDDGEFYDARFIAQLTSYWDGEIRSTSSSTDEQYEKYIVSIPHTCDHI
jgi:hypothetical protein